MNSFIAPQRNSYTTSSVLNVGCYLLVCSVFVDYYAFSFWFQNENKLIFGGKTCVSGDQQQATTIVCLLREKQFF